MYTRSISIRSSSAGRTKAEASGLADRITAHLVESDLLPLGDGVLNHITARNTIIYIADPVKTFKEFRRVLKRSGIAHAIEGDWCLTAVEPLGAEWNAIVEAISWAWPIPEIGRKLYGLAWRAGFSRVDLQVVTKPDTDGRLLGMIKTVADYARDGGKLESTRIDAALQFVERDLQERSYLAVEPSSTDDSRLRGALPTTDIHGSINPSTPCI